MQASLSIRFPLQLTYPIEFWSVPARLSNPAERNRFLEALANECGIRGACREMGMAYGSVYRYIAAHQDFKAEVYAICELIPTILHEEAREIADAATPQTWAVDRLRADVRIRTAGYHKAPVEVHVDNRTQTVNVIDPERAKLIAKLEASRTRALANREENKQLEEGKH